MRILKRTSVLAFIVSLSVSAHSQTFYTPDFDTIRFNHRTGGEHLGSDQFFLKQATTLPGSGFGSGNSEFSLVDLQDNPSLYRRAPLRLDNSMLYSGLPHFGFAYTFGTAGSQIIHADYQQLLRNKHLLNLDLMKRSSNELSRNSTFSESDFQLKYLYRGERLRTRFNGVYRSDETSINAGLSDTLSLVSFGIAFAPVNKANALSKLKSGQITWKNYLNLLPGADSLNTKLGIHSVHELGVKNREYSETDTLYGLYPQINIDSISTRDQYQQNDLSSGLGAFFTTKKLELSAAFVHRYRRLQNLGRYLDTNELAFRADLRVDLPVGRLNSYNEVNLAGANQEWNSVSTYNLKFGKYKLEAKLKAEERYTELLQRTYFANSIDYGQKADANQKLFEASIGGKLELKDWLELELGVQTVSRSNVLVWQNFNWETNEFSSFTANQLRLATRITLGEWTFLPFYQVQKGSIFIPTRVYGGRIAWSKRVFEAQKMNLLFALDYKGMDGYNLLQYNPLLDTWVMNPNGKFQSSRYELHASVGFAIDEFRFFIRAENIHHFFSSRTNLVADHFYRAPLFIRIGLTWDLFN
jgi:hypothetical protein